MADKTAVEDALKLLGNAFQVLSDNKSNSVYQQDDQEVLTSEIEDRALANFRYTLFFLSW